jgi:hypothetical protein
MLQIHPLTCHNSSQPDLILVNGMVHGGLMQILHQRQHLRPLHNSSVLTNQKKIATSQNSWTAHILWQNASSGAQTALRLRYLHMRHTVHVLKLTTQPSAHTTHPNKGQHGSKRVSANTTLCKQETKLRLNCYHCGTPPTDGLVTHNDLHTLNDTCTLCSSTSLICSTGHLTSV